ncbi:hypothetical protein PENTCL1PPCAC_18803, partial [Pristionchus entomophagus]
RSVDGPVENKEDPSKLLDLWNRSRNSIVQERDFPPGLFAAANRDDDSGFAYYRRFAADKDEDGECDLKFEKKMKTSLPTASRFAADNIDPHPLVHNRADLLWTRR